MPYSYFMGAQLKGFFAPLFLIFFLSPSPAQGGFWDCLKLNLGLKKIPKEEKVEPNGIAIKLNHNVEAWDPLYTPANGSSWLYSYTPETGIFTGAKRKEKEVIVTFPIFNIPTPGSDRPGLVPISFGGKVAYEYYYELTEVILAGIGTQLKTIAELKQRDDKFRKAQREVEEFFQKMRRDSVGLTIPAYLEKVRPTLPPLTPEMQMRLQEIPRNLLGPK